MFMELLHNHLAWFAFGVILIVLEGFDGSFSIFATSSAAAMLTSLAVYLEMNLHPFSIFSIALVISYFIFHYFFKITTSNKDINELD